MVLNIREINERVRSDAKGFVLECEAAYAQKVDDAARKIAGGIKKSNVVLLSGPSGSGKTTTAHKLAATLEKYGINTHSISMDNYFKTVNPDTAPRTSDGKIDYESPLCLDIDLLKEHIAKLAEGEEILVPKFNFTAQKRSEITKPLKLMGNEIVIIEGIHALNDVITSAAGGHGVKLYISSRSNFELDGEIYFKGTWTRIVRRTIRDERFRGTKADFTLTIWDSIRNGEKAYISPFKNKADIIINSTHPYEVNMLKTYFHVPELDKSVKRYDEINMLGKHIGVFGAVSETLVPKDSLLREFIGGGCFKY
ncbi:MAG: AAA family ATPase [Clostridiales bacterium]|nr:AAA family ATPase [Clostridiales bacterium]